MGDFRPPASGLPGKCVAPECKSSSCGGTGLDLWLGTLRWEFRSCYRHEHIRSFSAAQRTTKKIRVRTGSSCCCCEAATRQELSLIVIPNHLVGAIDFRKRSSAGAWGACEST